MKQVRVMFICFMTCIILFYGLSISKAATLQHNNKLVGVNVLISDNSNSIVRIPETKNGKLVTYVNLPKEIFNNTKIKKLILPKGIKDIISEDYYETDSALLQNYKSITPGCPYLEAVEVDKDNPNLTSVDGILYSKDKKTLLYCPPAKKGVLIVPEGVQTIGFMAFQDCSELTEIELPSTIKTIGEAAFGGNTKLVTLGISEANKNFISKSNVIFTIDVDILVAYAGGITQENYVIPSGVKEIRDGAFMGNTYLKKLTTQAYLTTVGIEAFKNCTSLLKVHFAKGLRDLYAGAFYNCSSLTAINLPDGTRFLYDDVLTGCKSLLKISLPSSIQGVSSGLGHVVNREIKIYNPHCSIDLGNDKKAKKIIVYTYKNSYTADYMKAQGVTIRYFNRKYITLSKTKVVRNAVKGKGKPEISWYVSSNTEFHIKNPDQLAGLAVLVRSGTDFSGKTIILSKDLDLSRYSSWIPIGCETDEEQFVFNGTFDGNKHIIYNLRINRTDVYQGLFGLTSGLIKNLTIKDADIAGGSYTGIITGSSKGTINNCNVSGSVTGYEKVGGITGDNYSSILSCNVNAKVNGVNTIGGLVGYNYGDVMNCTNKGSVYGWDCAGGIAGHASKGNIKNCNNRMEVSGDINIGGIVGLIANEAEIHDCVNIGNLTANENAGGIIGSFSFDGTAKNCTNQGKISAVFNVGGIAGYLSVGSLYHCKNEASVIGSFCVGGVIGKLGFIYPVEERVFDCTNIGSVSGVMYHDVMIGKDVCAQNTN